MVSLRQEAPCFLVTSNLLEKIDLWNANVECLTSCCSQQHVSTAGTASTRGPGRHVSDQVRSVSYLQSRCALTKFSSVQASWMCQWSRYAAHWRSHKGRRSSCSSFSSVRLITCNAFVCHTGLSAQHHAVHHALDVPDTGHETGGAPLQGSSSSSSCSSSRLVVISGRSRLAQNSNSCSKVGHRGRPLCRLPALR